MDAELLNRALVISQRIDDLAEEIGYKVIIFADDKQNHKLRLRADKIDDGSGNHTAIVDTTEQMMDVLKGLQISRNLSR